MAVRAEREGYGGPATRAHLGGGAGGPCRWPGASGPDSPGACAPARPATPRRLVDQPAVPPFRPPEPVCECAAALCDSHSPSPFSILQLTLSLPSSLPIIHSPPYWCPVNLSNVGTFPLTWSYHILKWVSLKVH